MAITISGSGITSANIADGTIVNADIADVAASKLTGALPAIDGSALTGMPAGGKVLQVLQSIVTTTTTSTSSTYNTISGMTVTITPASTASKILVMFSFNGHGNNYGSALRLVRGSTSLPVGTAVGSRVGGLGAYHMGEAGEMTHVSGQSLDAPATTSATTYALQWRTNGGTDFFNRSESDLDSSDYPRAASSITVMEIGA